MTVRENLKYRCGGWRWAVVSLCQRAARGVQNTHMAVAGSATPVRPARRPSGARLKEVPHSLSRSAALRLPRGTAQSERETAVRGVLNMLGLAHVQHDLVGSAGRKGLSGGQRKGRRPCRPRVHHAACAF